MGKEVIVFPDGTPCIKRKEDVKELLEIGEVRAYDSVPLTRSQLLERIRDATGIYLDFSKLDEILMRSCSNLKAVCFLGVGAASFVDIEAATRLRIAVMNTPGYGSNAVAEHALTLMLSVARKVVFTMGELRSGRWNQSRFTGFELSGKTLGILGLGPIGSRVAELGNALGMRVICWTRNPTPERAIRYHVEFWVLEEVFKQADFVSVHLPFTQDLAGIVTRELLMLLKPTAIFINTARAELVDNEALVELLRSGRIMGAGIDVYENEPPDAENPLLHLPNVIATPHVGYNTEEANKRMLRIAIDNFVGFFVQGRPQNILNPEVLERMK